MDFAVSADHRVNMKEREKNRQILGTCLRSEKTEEPEGDGNTNCSRYVWNFSHRLGEMYIYIYIYIRNLADHNQG